jgi:uncharacterized protein
MIASIQSQYTAAQARSMEQTVTRMIASLRRTGTLPPGLQPGAGLAQVFQRPLGEAVQIDRYDPAAVAAKLPANTPVLLTCSNADGPTSRAQEDQLAAGLRQAPGRLDYIHLDGVDHFLKEDEPLPFSAQLGAALKTFLASNL